MSSAVGVGPVVGAEGLEKKWWDGGGGLVRLDV